MNAVGKTSPSSLKYLGNSQKPADPNSEGLFPDSQFYPTALYTCPSASSTVLKNCSFSVSLTSGREPPTLFSVQGCFRYSESSRSPHEF